MGSYIYSNLKALKNLKMNIKQRIKNYIHLVGSEDKIYIEHYTNYNDNIISLDNINICWKAVKLAYSKLVNCDCSSIPLNITVEVIDDYYKHCRGMYAIKSKKITINIARTTTLLRTLIHELTHHLQSIIKPNYYNSFLKNINADDENINMNLYMLDSSETEAWCIAWRFSGGIELDIFYNLWILVRLKIMYISRKLGVKFSWEDLIKTITK